MPSLFTALLDANTAADECFKQANRSFSGFLTPGEMLLQLQECSCPDPAGTLPQLFLQLDLDDDNKISRSDMRAGYKQYARPAGLRVKTSGAPEPKAASEMEALEQTALAALQPKITALEQCFNLLDLGKTGQITARKCAPHHNARSIPNIYDARRHRATAANRTRRARALTRGREHSHCSRLEWRVLRYWWK